MYGYTITKTDPSNKEYIGKSAGKISKADILAAPDKVEFICLDIGTEGFVRGFYLADDTNIDFEPLDHFQDDLGFTSLFYKEGTIGTKDIWTEL